VDEEGSRQVATLQRMPEGGRTFGSDTSGKGKGRTRGRTRPKAPKEGDDARTERGPRAQGPRALETSTAGASTTSSPTSQDACPPLAESWEI